MKPRTNTSLAVALSLATLLAAACGGDDTPGQSASSPAGQVQTGDKSCAQIGACFDACNDADETCFETCFFSGTAAAQQQMNALDDCEYDATLNQCKDKCAGTTPTQACGDCIAPICGSQKQACGL